MQLVISYAHLNTCGASVNKQRWLPPQCKIVADYPSTSPITTSSRNTCLTCIRTPTLVLQYCILQVKVLHKQDSVQYLGATVDKQLSWKSHIANVQRICWGKISSIRRSSVYLPKQVRKMLHLCFLILHLDYCSVVWHNCSVVLTSVFECIQNYALSVILKKASRSDTKEMRSQLSRSTLEHRRLTSTLLQVHRCLHGQYLSHIHI